jgi:hypothetical protein
MNRISFAVGTLALLALLGCAPKTEQPVSEAPAPAAKEAAVPATPAPAPDGVLPMSYMDAATALAADDFDKAKVSLTALAKQSTGEMQSRAQTAANAPDIVAMRESFKELSAIASEMQLPPEYAVAFCPMYKGGSKWVQKKETLANPYYGKTMLTCGSFVN